MDERPDVVTIPTELERSDAAWDIAVGLGVLLGAVYCVKPPDMGGLGLPWPFLIPPLLPVALYVLTGEYAGDLPWIGGVASGLRSKLGARRAHEWIQAYAWYARVTLIPNGRDYVDRCRVAGMRMVHERRHHIRELAVWSRLGHVRAVLRAKRGS